MHQLSLQFSLLCICMVSKFYYFIFYSRTKNIYGGVYKSKYN